MSHERYIVKTSKRSRFRTVLSATFLLFLVVGTIYIIRRHVADAWYEQEGAVFGTYYHVKYRATADLHNQIQRELTRIDATFSLFNKESLLSQINANRTDTTDTLFRTVFSLAQEVSQATNGAFDITVAPLVEAWGFGPAGNKTLPTDAVIDSLRSFVGFKKVQIVKTHVVKQDPRVQLDFSAIAKGLAVDGVAEVLHTAGAEDYMVEIGGEVVTRGKNPEGKLWTVGVVKPTTEDATIGLLQEVLSLSTCAMATSGNYLNFHKAGNTQVGHTIDPRTGRPVSHNLLSATVFAPTCATADAYATAFMVIGLDSARAIVESHKDIEAYFIYEDASGCHQVWRSEHMPKSVAGQ